MLSNPGPLRQSTITKLRDVTWFLIVVALVPTLCRSTSGQDVDFARDVRPLLSQMCFKCHGPDEKSRQGGLRLDVREDALRGGDSEKAAINLTNVRASEILARVSSTDPDTVMPPPSTKRTLTADQIALLESWIKKGAEYKEHWAFTPRQVTPGSWFNANDHVASSPIDHLINQQARSAGLELAPAAPDHVWLRRAYLDLTGLPPTYEQVVAFQGDKSADRRERVVDRLLASPAFGERWGRRWLDIARYADTNGYEKDRPRSIWPYRDWVLQAFNSDMPLSDFTIKQLAGDLLPNPTIADRIATGFHRNTMINEEGGIDPLEYRYYAMVDRVNTTSTAWLGLTMGCAQCHDHKYDPLTQQDYYALMALLNDAEEPELEIEDADTVQAQQRIDEQVATLEARRQQEFPLDQADVKWTTANIIDVKSDALRWRSAQEGQWFSSLDASRAKPEDTSNKKANRNARPNSEANGAAPDKDNIEVRMDLRSLEREPTAPANIVAIRLRALRETQDSTDAQVKKATDSATPSAIGWSKTNNFVITRVEVSAEQTSEQGEPRTTTSSKAVPLASATATFEQSGYSAAGTLDQDPKTGWGVGGNNGAPCEITWMLAEPIALGSASALQQLRLNIDQQFGGSHLLRGFASTWESTVARSMN